MAYSRYSGFIPRCQHIKTNGVQCGSPALHRRRFCYFHNRWRGTRVDLNRAGAYNLITTVELPVLEDADSIQVALMQVMGLILRRQLDGKTGGLMLYGLQIASSNLSRTDFEHCHKSDVIIDRRNIPQTGVGDEAWSPEDFEEEEEESTPENEANEPATHVATAASAVRQAQRDATTIPAAPTSPETKSKKFPPTPVETTEAAEPTLKKSAERRENATQGASPAATAPNESAPKERHNSRTGPSPNHAAELAELQRVQTALQGAQRGNWRDLKTVFEFTGVYPPKDQPPHGKEPS
jgi:hypothetical protein